jgi:hypothetical protein
MNVVVNLIEKACKTLGEKNRPVYTVAFVALFKGIFRPLFTMSDKKQDSKTKKYAAIREGSTELIAIPTYIGLSWATEKLAPKFAYGNKSIKKILESNAKSTLGFIGVCAAALIVIPGLCNLAMPHILKAFGQKKDSNKQQPNEISSLNPIISKPVQNLQLNKPAFQRLNLYKPSSTQSGMGVSL